MKKKKWQVKMGEKKQIFRTKGFACVQFYKNQEHSKNCAFKSFKCTHIE